MRELSMTAHLQKNWKKNKQSGKKAADGESFWGESTRNKSPGLNSVVRDGISSPPPPRSIQFAGVLAHAIDYHLPVFVLVGGSERDGDLIRAPGQMISR